MPGPVMSGRPAGAGLKGILILIQPVLSLDGSHHTLLGQSHLGPSRPYPGALIYLVQCGHMGWKFTLAFTWRTFSKRSEEISITGSDQLQELFQVRSDRFGQRSPDHCDWPEHLKLGLFSSPRGIGCGACSLLCWSGPGSSRTVGTPGPLCHLCPCSLSPRRVPVRAAAGVWDVLCACHSTFVPCLCCVCDCVQAHNTRISPCMPRYKCD